MSTNKKISEFDIITTMAEGAEIPVIQGSPKQNARISQKNFTKDIGLDAVKNKVDNLEVNVADGKLKVTSVVKTYQTEALALADKNPIDTATSLPLTVGQFVSIVDDGEKNGIYRISSISGDGTMSLELQGKLGDMSDYAKKGGSTKTLKEVEDIAKATFGRLMPFNPQNINFDVTNNQLIISGTNRLLTANSHIYPPIGTVAMPTAFSGVYRIEFNPTLSSWEIKQVHAEVVLSNIIIGGYRRLDSRIWVHGIEEYSINGSLPLEENYDESRGEFFSTTSSIINFNTVTQMVEFPAGRVFYKRASYSVSATSVAKTDAYDRGKIYFDIDSREITIVPLTQGGAIPDSKIQIGLYDIGSGVFDISSKISVNGVDTTPSLVSRGELTSINEGGVNFDLLNLELSITNRCRVTYEGSTVLTRAQTISLAPILGTWSRLLFNRVSGDFFFLETHNVAYPEGSIQVGRVLLEGSSRVIVLEIGRYSVNGEESGISRSRIDTASYIAVNGNTDASYVQPDIDGFEWITTAVSSQMYALYDDLVTQYPSYVTRTLLGNDTIGNPIYRYDFTPPLHLGGKANYAPKMILTSGHHGYEKAGIYVPYAAMKEICTRWEEDERLETLRWGVHFIVVPIVCPYGFDNNTRVNERGVDPDRNYPIGWSSAISDPTSGQYRGEAPLSEPSAQYVDAILRNNRDAIYFCSFHNMQGETGFIWNASSTVFGRSLASGLISRLTGAWNKRFPWATGDVGIGYSDLGAPSGSSGNLSTRAYGIQGGTFEISRVAGMAGDKTLWGSLVATLGTEVFINWLLLNLEHGAKFKNSSIRLPG